MVFSSISFLCVFLPIVFILYSLICNIKIQNILLVIASLLFYGYGEPVYVFLMILCCFFNYLFALLVKRGDKKYKGWLALAVISNLGMLGVFKYSGLAVTTVNQIFHSKIPVPHIVLPIGISFFTFQALSYVIDVYRDTANKQKNFGKVLLYVSFFPQLIAGPIVKYHDIATEIDSREQKLDEVVSGIRRFVIGLSKKILISNTMGIVADQVFGASTFQINVAGAWIGAIAYLLQIYYDFSGYSDMALGLGHMFGFHFKENFQYPYASTSIKEFWRRWHISLSGWFKEYLYIPLGGNRKGRVRTWINKIIVFFCTGLWHGANWTFVVWGLYHGAFLLLEDLIPKAKKIPKLLGHVYTLIVVCFGFVIFRANTLTQGLYMIKEMVSGFHFNQANISFAIQQCTPLVILTIVIGFIGSMPIKVEFVNKIKNTKTWSFWQGSSYIISIVLLLLCLISLSGGTYNPFIYFQF